MIIIVTTTDTSLPRSLDPTMTHSTMVIGGSGQLVKQRSGLQIDQLKAQLRRSGTLLTTSSVGGANTGSLSLGGGAGGGAQGSTGLPVAGATGGATTAAISPQVPGNSQTINANNLQSNSTKTSLPLTVCMFVTSN